MPREKLLNYIVLISSVLFVTACRPPHPGDLGGGLGGPDRQGPPPFSELDLNGDGKLLLDEFKQHEIPHGKHAEVFKTIDADGDGVVTQAELENHRPPAPASH